MTRRKDKLRQFWCANALNTWCWRSPGNNHFSGKCASNKAFRLLLWAFGHKHSTGPIFPNKAGINQAIGVLRAIISKRVQGALEAVLRHPSLFSETLRDVLWHQKRLQMACPRQKKGLGEVKLPFKNETSIFWFDPELSKRYTHQGFRVCAFFFVFFSIFFVCFFLLFDGFH